MPHLRNGKTRPVTLKKLHQFLQPPEVIFQRPALDFVIGLPESQNPATGMRYDMICTIIDGLTKYFMQNNHNNKRISKVILEKKYLRIMAFLNKSSMTEINCSR